jgi:Carboxypeptidase regulatory-like domain
MPSQVASRTLAVILLVLAPTAAFAQASITGVVRDASGAVLPGATVEAASPALIEKSRAVVTGANGQYRIVDLRPGTYTVTFTLTGFSTVRREAVELAGSLTATVDVEMRVGGVEETVTVTGETPLVDVQGVQKQWVLDKEIIDTLPTGRTAINVAVLIPGMMLSTTFSGEGQDVGGNTGEVQQTLSIHGSRGGDMRRMVDGLSMQSQGTSVSAFAANSGMIQEVTVDTAAGSAEQSAGGVRMNIVPREGGNTFTGSLFLAGTNEDLQSNNIDEELRQEQLGSEPRLRRTAASRSHMVLCVRTCVRGQQLHRQLRRELERRRSKLVCVRSGYQLPRVARHLVAKRQRTCDVANGCQEQGEPLCRRPGPLQLYRLACLDGSRSVSGLQIPLEAAGDRHLCRPDYQQGAPGSRLRPQARGLGLLHA